MRKILVTGATGQIGSELVPKLREHYGAQNVVACGHRKEPDQDLLGSGPYLALDVRDGASINRAVEQHGIDTVFHLAAILSAKAEADPQLAWDINMNGLVNVLEAARQFNLAVFHPSSIGAFGPTTPPVKTPQETIQRPNTVYGVTKVAGELLCDYYHVRFGIDTRGVRYPGLISSKTMPGGGTTDYAVEIFYEAVERQSYICFLGPDSCLDMMYMDDALRAAIDLMEADPDKLRFRNAYNITGMSLTPEEISAAIRKRIPAFKIAYEIDPVRQAIADSWPDSLDDSAARDQWGWFPEYDLEKMTDEMLTKIRAKLAVNN